MTHTLIGKRYQAFISCPFSESDAAVIRWFTATIERLLPIDCYVACDRQPLPTQDKVLENIASRDCLIAIVPKSRSSWIDSEIGMALALNKPVIAFYEEGVDPTGPYSLVADYGRFNRTSLESTLDSLVQLANQLVRLLDSRIVSGVTRNIFVYKLLSTDEEIQNRLIELLAETRHSVDLWCYSTETFLKDKFLSSLSNERDIELRVLIRHPDSDPLKGHIIEGKVKEMRAVLGTNRVRVRGYRVEPFMRTVLFETSALLGMYRWVPNTVYKFIGAENNSLVEFTNDTSLGNLWLGLIRSRFAYAWDQSEPFDDAKL